MSSLSEVWGNPVLSSTTLYSAQHPSPLPAQYTPVDEAEEEEPATRKKKERRHKVSPRSPPLQSPPQFVQQPIHHYYYYPQPQYGLEMEEEEEPCDSLIDHLDDCRTCRRRARRYLRKLHPKSKEEPSKGPGGLSWEWWIIILQLVLIILLFYMNWRWNRRLLQSLTLRQ